MSPRRILVIANETAESLVAGGGHLPSVGELLTWGALGQLPAAVLAAAVLSWLLAAFYFLTFGGFEPIVSVEKESVSKPVPDKVMDDMRSCGAGIVHVGSESTYMDKGGKEVKVLNENVLIEIGGAMALYKRNFILLVERGVTLPSKPTFKLRSVFLSLKNTSPLALTAGQEASL